MATAQKTIHLNLGDEATFDHLTRYVREEVVVFDMFSQALTFVRNMEGYFSSHPSFGEEHPRLFTGYQDAMTLAKFICLPALRESEIVSLLIKHYTMIYSMGVPYDLLGKLKAYIVGISPYNERDTAKQAFAKALSDNAEQLTDKPLTTNNERRQPTIAYWLTDYRSSVNHAYDDELAVSQYLTGSANIKMLDEQGRTRIKDLVEMYNYLKTSSLSVEGIDEKVSVITDDGPRTYDAGTFIDNAKLRSESEKIQDQLGDFDALTDKWIEEYRTLGKVVTPVPTETTDPSLAPSGKSRPLPSPNDISSYLRQSELDAQIAQKEAQLLSEVGKGTMDVRETLNAALAAKDGTTVIALLNVLAETRDLEKLIAGDHIFATKLVAKFGKAVGEHFDAHPSSPPYVRAYLEYILQDNLRLSVSDAARIGVRLGNILGKRYLKMAFMDMASGTFSWAPVAEKDGALQLMY